MKENFLKRLGTAAILLGVFLALFVISAYSPFFELAIALLICTCIYEALTCTGCATQKKLLVPSLIYGALVPLSFTVRDFLYPSRNPYFGIIIISFVYMVALFIMLMATIEKTSFADATITMFITFVITCFLSNIILIRQVQGHGLFYMILCIVCSAWCTDIFAYLTGILLGKHRPFKKISPKKSVEGCIGGSAFSIGFFMLFCLIYSRYNGVNICWWLAAVYALLCTLIGQIGDLSFSYIKRSYGVKDFGKILPGHGGFLDRLDSLIFIAPTFFAMLNTSEFIW